MRTTIWAFVAGTSPHTEMAGQADPLDLQAHPAADLHDQDREGDRDTELAIEDVVEAAVARVVVVVGIAAEARFVEQEVTQSLERAAPIAELRRGRAGRELVESRERVLRHQVGILDPRNR